MMKNKRFDAKHDANQLEIVRALEESFCRVYVIERPFDLLVARSGKLYLLEVKNPGVRYRLTDEQQKEIDWLAMKGVAVHIVKSVDEALKAIGLL